MCFVSFGTHIPGDETLQLQLHLSKLIMTGQYLRLTGFKSRLIIKREKFVAKKILKLDNTINNC